ncbi:MAG: hypothetical protein ACTSQE_09125 [Candidatus Heimdallarchaeaceae archaeon]
MIPIDSKIILPLLMEKPENIIFDEKRIFKLNKGVILRAKETERYIEPAITTNFVLMYIKGRLTYRMRMNIKINCNLGKYEIVI